MSALAAYRQLLRASRVAFDGDARVLAAAREQIRDGFRLGASKPPSDPTIPTAIQGAYEVAAFLRSNVVQGKKEGEDLYRLRIHEETERGDNDTIKMGDGKTIKIDGKKCTDK